MLCPSGVTVARWHRRSTFCACVCRTWFTASHWDINKTHLIYYFLWLSHHKKRSSVGPLTTLRSTWCLCLSLAAQTITPLSCSRAVVHLWWSSSGFRERPTVWSATKIDAMSSTSLFFKPQEQKCELMGRLRVWHIDSFMSSFWMASLPASSGRVGREPKPSGSTGSATEFRLLQLESNSQFVIT